MKKLFLMSIFVLLLGMGCSTNQVEQHVSRVTSTVHANQKMCFQNVGLRDTYVIRMEVDGDTVAGTVTLDNSVDQPIIFPFTAVKRGGIFEKIRFENNKVPPILGVQKDISWKLVKPSDQQMLEVKIYGQNYETKNFSWYEVEFEQCMVR